MKESSNIYHKQNRERERERERENDPLECIFSNMEMASIAIHATISADILKPQKRKLSYLFTIILTNSPQY